MPTQIEYDGAKVTVDHDMPDNGLLPSRFIRAVCEALEDTGRHDLSLKFSEQHARRPQPGVYALPEQRR